MAMSSQSRPAPLSTDEEAQLPELMTVRQTAAFLQLSTDAVSRLIRRGQLRAARLGRSYRILRSELLADIEALAETQRREREQGDR